MFSGFPRAKAVRVLSIFLLSAALGTQAQQPIGSLKASDTSVRGSVVLATNGAAVMSGAQLSSGDHGAEITLARGGVVRLCPRTQLDLSASSSGRELLLALGAGSLDLDYELGSSADAIMTPDFRIQLPGPGIFRYSVDVNQHGDVCVESHPGSSSSVIVYELMGDGAHQVRPGEAVVFHGGSINDASKPVAGCGCPAPPPAVLNVRSDLSFPEAQSRKAAVEMAEAAPVAPGFDVLPESQQPVFATVDAPIVFRGEDLPPPPVRTASLKLTKPALPILAQDVAPPPPPELRGQGVSPAPKKEKRNWLHRLGSAIARLFH